MIMMVNNCFVYTLRIKCSILILLFSIFVPSFSQVTKDVSELVDSVLLNDSLAAYYEEIGNLRKAQEYAAKNVEINSIVGKKTVPYAISTLKLARYIFPNEGDYDKELSMEGLSILQDSLGPKSSTYINYLLEYAWRQYKYDQLQEACTIVRNAAEDSYNGDEIYLGYLYYSCGHFFKEAEELQEARKYAQKAVTFYEEKGRCSDKYYPLALIDLAFLGAPDLEFTITYLTKAKESIEHYKGRETTEYLDVILDFSYVYRSAKQLDKALEYAQQAKMVGETIKDIDNSSYLYTLEYVANLYSNQKRYKDAITYAEKCLSLMKEDKGFSIEDRLPAIDSLVVYYMNITNEEKTNLYYDRIKLYAKEAYLIRKNLNIAGEEMTKNLFCLLLINDRLGKYDECEENVRELETIYGDTFSTRCTFYYDAMGILMNSLFYRKKYKESLDVSKKVYSSYMKQFGDDSEFLADLYKKQAYNYTYLGDYDNYHDCSIKALEIIKRLFGEISSKYLKDLSTEANHFCNIGFTEESYVMFKKGADIAQKLYGRVHLLFVSNYLSAMSLWEEERGELFDDYQFEDLYRFITFYRIITEINNNQIDLSTIMDGMNAYLQAALPKILCKSKDDTTGYKALYNSFLLIKAKIPNVEQLKSQIQEELGENSRQIFEDFCSTNSAYLNAQANSEPTVVDSLYKRINENVDVLSRQSLAFEAFLEKEITVENIGTRLLESEVVIDYIPLKDHGDNDLIVILDNKRLCPIFVPVTNLSEQIKQICSSYTTTYFFIDNDSIISNLNIDSYKTRCIVGYDLSIEHIMNREEKNIAFSTESIKLTDADVSNIFTSACNEFERGINLYNKKQYQKAITAFYLCDSLMYIAKGESSNYFGYGERWIASCLHKMGNDSIAKRYSQYYNLPPIDMRQTVLSDSILDIAGYLYDNGNKNESLEKYLEASKFEKANVGKNSYWYANTISHCAEICNEIEDYERAIELEMEALNIRKQSLGVDHIDYYWSLKNLYHSYSALKLFEEENKYGGLLVDYMEKHKEILGSELLLYPIYNSALAKINTDNKQHQKALSFIMKSINSADLLIDYPPAYMNIYYKAIMGLGLLGQDSLSFELCKKIIPFYENNSEELLNPNEYFEILLFAANHYYNQGDYITTSVYQERALDKIRDKDNLLYGTALSNLALTYCELGRIDASVKLAEDALGLVDSIQYVDEYAKRLLNLAHCYAIANKPKDALRCGKKCYNFLYNYYGLDNNQTIVAANNLASYYNDLGYHDESGRLLFTIMEYAEKDEVKNGEILGSIYNNIAMNWHGKDFDVKERLKYIAKSYEIRKKILGEHDLYTIQSLYNKGRFLLDLEDISEGIACIREALDQTKKIIGEKNLRYIEMMKILPEIYGKGGDLKRALEIEEKRFELIKGIVDDNNITYLQVLDNLTELFFYMNDTLKMYNTIIRESRNYRKMVISDFPNYTSIERANFVGRMGRFFDWLFPLICYYKHNPELCSEYYNALLLRKGILLNSEIEFSRLIRESGNSTLLSNYNDLIANKNLLNKQFQLPIEQRVFDIDSLKHIINEKEEYLVSASKEYGDYTNRFRTNWKDIRDKLKEGELSVEFVEFYDTCAIQNRIYYALVISKFSESPELVPLCTEQQIHEVVNSDNSRELYQLIWNPILQKSKNVNTLFFSPAGILNNLGIEYVDINEYENISDKYAIYRLSSTREIVEDQEAACKSAALYGGLDYSVDTDILLAQNDRSGVDASSSVMYRGLSDSLSVRNSFEPLYNTRTEIAEIDKTLKKGNVAVSMYSDTFGTEESFKALSGKGMNLIHLATHGMYIGASEAESKKRETNLSFIQLDDNGGGLIQEDKSLSRSFLVMSGGDMLPSHKEVPDNLEDGILTASEISKLDLRGLDLVVLSACQTALGDIDNEGVYGLQRGFKKAGAKTILMSLDKVDDEATKILMVDFYNNLMSGKSKHQSLKDAQKHLRLIDNGKYNKPEYWASFIMLDGLN